MKNPVNQFAWDLFDTLKEDRIFLSPYGIYSALAALAHGAPAGCDTSRELMDVLHCDSLEDMDGFIRGTAPVAGKDDIFRSSNLILIDSDKAKEKGVVQEYVDTVKELLGTKVSEADIGKNPEKVRKFIRDWANESTNGMISDYQSVLTPDAMAVILNAVAFKGRWLYAFDHDDSFTDVFHNADGSESNQRFMSERIYGPMYYAQDKSFRVAKLAYLGGYHMFIVLPLHEDDLNVFKEWTSKSQEYRRKLISDSGVHVEELELVLPRFEMSCNYDLRKVLESIGVKISMSDSAEYSRIIEGELLKIGAAKHQSRLKVDENGTEAAAVTEIVMVGCTATPPPPPVPKFVCDIPFIFSICSDDGTMLFTGYYGKSLVGDQPQVRKRGDHKPTLKERIFGKEPLDEDIEEF